MAGASDGTASFSSDGAAIRAYLAQPPGAGAPHPAVIVIHEWWGLTDHMKDIAQRFARAGYVALVPDLYSRQGNTVTTDAAQAASLMNALQSQQVLLDLNAAVRFLKEQPDVDPLRLGVVGFCMGGTFALMAATHNSDLKAAVPFYGKVAPNETLARLLAPVLYHYGAQDGWVTKQEVDTLQNALKLFNKAGAVQTYPDAGHAFFNDTRPDAYHAPSAALAWERTLAFLGQHLR